MNPRFYSHLATSVRSLRAASPRGEFAAYLLLLIAVPLLPVPYGAVLPGGTVKLQAAAFIIAALTFATAKNRETLRTIRLPLLFLLSLTALAIFQLLPVSQQALAHLSPTSASVYRDANEVLRLYGVQPATTRISIAPGETVDLLLLILAYGAFGISATVLLNNRARRRLFCYVLIASSIASVAFAVAPSTGDERIHGSFVNPNHLGGYLQLALFVTFGLVWGEVLMSRDRAKGVRDAASALEKRLAPLAIPVLAFGGVAAGIGLTRSRGAVAAAAISLLFVLAVGVTNLIRKRRGRTLFTATIAAIAAIWFALATAKHDFVLRFIASDPREVGSDTRIQLWRTSVEAWKQYPLFGSGLGTFREAFRPVQGSSVEGLVEQAHNDFLQMLVTGGAIGGALVALLFGSILWSLASLWRRQQHREERSIVLGGLGALIALTLHGLVEFNFSIPAIPATFAIVMGLAFAAGSDDQSYLASPRRNRQPNSPPERETALSE